MTPAGHLSVSYITGRTFRNISISAVVIGGTIPDIDFIFIFFDWFNQVHRVVSHNLTFVCLAALAGLAFSPTGRKRAVCLGLAYGGLIHLFIDSVMDNNPSNGIGIMFLWPFNDQFFSPFNILEVQHKFGWEEPDRMFRALLPTMLYELPFYLTALSMYVKKRNKRRYPRVS